jgi:hypothetical protein
MAWIRKKKQLLYLQFVAPNFTQMEVLSIKIYMDARLATQILCFVKLVLGYATKVMS